MKLRTPAKLILLITVFLGCAGREPTPGVTDTEILIGNIQDLSGPMMVSKIMTMQDEFL